MMPIVMLLRDDGYQDGVTTFNNLTREIRTLTENQQGVLLESTTLEGRLASANERRRNLELPSVTGEPQRVFQAKSVSLPDTLPKNRDGSVKKSSKEYKAFVKENPSAVLSSASSSASRAVPESPDVRARAIARRLTEERASRGLYSPGDAPPRERPMVYQGMPPIPFNWSTGEGRSHYRHRGLASMRPQYGRDGQESGSEPECGCESDCECECGCHREQHHYGRIRALGYDDTRNEMYNC